MSELDELAAARDEAARRVKRPPSREQIFVKRQMEEHQARLVIAIVVAVLMVVAWLLL